MRIAMVNNRYGGMAGGIERFSLTFADWLIDRDHQVSMISWDHRDATPHYKVAEKIKWIRLHEVDAMSGVLDRMSVTDLLNLRRHFFEFKPNVILCFQHGSFLVALISSLGLGSAVVLAERHSPQRMKYSRSSRFMFLWWVWMSLSRAIFVQIPEYTLQYPSFLRKRIQEIPNPVSIPDLDPEIGHRDFNILCVGRLHYQKNQAALIRAFSRLGDVAKDWKLVFVGEGPDRPYLEVLSRDMGCSERIVFAGQVTDVSSWYLSSSIFCLPSLWEGFPNALAEAMAHNMACIGFGECDGVRHLIDNDVSGLLVKGVRDEVALAEGLERLIVDSVLRERLGAAGRLAMKKYSMESVLSRWENALIKLS